MSANVRLSELKDSIADSLEEHIRPLFDKRPQYRFTFIARLDGNEEMDVLITQEPDRIDEIIQLLERSRGKKYQIRRGT